MLSKKIVFPIFVMLVLTIFLSAPVFAESQFDWQKFAGEEIRIVGTRFFYTELIQKKLQDFEKLTGIKVNLELYPEDQFRQKIVVELAGGSTTVDAFTIGVPYEGRRFFKSGWCEPLEKYIENPEITDPEWDISDFIQSSWNAGVIEGQRIAIPLNTVTWLLIYRKDLYSDLGLTIPKTMEQLELNANKLTRDGVYGFVGRGKRTQSISTWAIFLHAFGGRWLDENHKPAFNSSEGIASLEFYAKLMQKYANPGAAENHWYDLLSMIQQGQVAQAIDTNAWLGSLSNPEESNVVNKIGWAPVPAGPKGDLAAELWSWSFAISSLSKKKEPAWLFIQWVTGKDVQKYIQLNGYPSSRYSAWNDPAFAEIVPQDWLESTNEFLKIARPICHPPVVEIGQVEDAIGGAIVDVILGTRESKEALDDAAKKVEEIMELTE